MTEQSTLSTAQRCHHIQVARESLFFFKRLFNSGCVLMHVHGELAERSGRIVRGHTGMLGNPQNILDVEVKLSGEIPEDVEELYNHLLLRLSDDPHLINAHQVWLDFTRVVMISRKVRHGIYPYRVGTKVRVKTGYAAWRSQNALATGFLSIHIREGVIQGYPVWRDGNLSCALVRAGDDLLGNVPVQFLEKQI